MALKFFCLECGGIVIVRYLKPGETALCRACGHEQTVPEGAEAATDAEAEAAAASQRAVPGRAVDPEDLKYLGDPFADRPPRYLAARWKRLLGYLADSLILIGPGVLMLFPAIVRVTDYMPDAGSLPDILPFMPEFWIARLFSFGLLLIQATLLVERGQTLGKMILGTRIVTLDDRHPRWWRLLLVRPAILVIVGLRPDLQWPDEVWSQALRYALGLLGLVNALYIFGLDRRTLHDRLAGTRVIDLRALRKTPDGDKIEKDFKRKP